MSYVAPIVVDPLVDLVAAILVVHVATMLATTQGPKLVPVGEPVLPSPKDF